MSGVVAGGPCHRCGRNPAAGFASVWSATEGNRWYCHGDDDAEPTCYERHEFPSDGSFIAELIGNPPNREATP